MMDRSTMWMLAAAVCLPYVMGDTCSPDGVFPCSNTITGNLILLLMYGGILGGMAKILSDGAEMLLLILSPGFTGGFLLPVLGALPDTAVIIASSLGPKDVAQKNLAVAAGCLAGSTVMLITVAFAASLWVARCDLKADGTAVEATLSPSNRWNLRNTGMSVGRDVPINSAIMLGTSVFYLIIQGVAFVYVSDPESNAARQHERNFVVATFVLCVIGFLCYGTYQMMATDQQEKHIQIAKEETQKRALMNKWSGLVDGLIASKHVRPQTDVESSPLVERSSQEKKSVDVGKFAARWKQKTVDKKEEIQQKIASDVEVLDAAKPAAGADEEENEYAHLSKAEIAVRAAGLIIFSVAVISVFSDAVVDVISELGDETSIPPFYISFVVTPMCSNASELISSLIFAARKTEENASVTFSQLFGAVCMNNTMGLGALTGLIYFRDLTWEFSAEVMCILVTIIVVSIMTMRRSYKTWFIFPIAFLYVFAIALVAFLENVVNWT